jgi:hypothetical protein
MKKLVMLGILFLFSVFGIFGVVSAVCPTNYTEIYTGTGVNGYFSTANLPTNCYAPEKCEILFMLQNKKTKAWTTRVTRDFSQQSDGKWTAYEVHYKKTRSGLNGNTRVSGLSTYDQEDTYLYDDSKNAETEKTKLTVRVTERNPVAVCVNTPTPSPNPPEPGPTPPLPTEEHRCSNPSQIIMRLSSSTNAHGQVWNYVGEEQSEELSYIGELTLNSEELSSVSGDCNLKKSFGNMPSGDYVLKWKTGAITICIGSACYYPSSTPWGTGVSFSTEEGERCFTTGETRGSRGVHYQYSEGTFYWPDTSRFSTSQQASDYFSGQTVNFTHGGGEIKVGVVDGTGSETMDDNQGSVTFELYEKIGSSVIDNTYPVEVCYDEIFNVSGDGIRTCNGNNEILKLSSLTNAHAEINTENNYNNSVCYGDLVCTSRNGSCAIGEKMVVSLSSETNAHLASDDSYDNLICCREGSVPPILDKAYWANMKDVPINSSDLRDWVKLVVPGVNVGENINYTIYKNRWWWFDQKISQSSSISYTLWQSGKNEEGSFSDGTYYFKAVIPNGTEFLSGTLEVSSTQNNSLPVAVLIKPEGESKHKINTPVSFEQASYDADDPLKVIWNFGDGSPTKTFEGCNIGTNCNTTYNYSNFGTKSIVLTAEEMGRGRKDSVRRRIFTYAKGINVFAIISKPSLNQVISGTRWVDFEASESYVSECFNSSSLCETESGAEECYEVGEENPLHCYDLSKDDIGTEYELHFRWSFDEGEPLQGTWSDNYDEVVTFSKLFLGANEHFADLRVGYEKL